MDNNRGEAGCEFSDPVLTRIVAFLREIGFTVRSAELRGDTFLPGVRVDCGELLVDEAKLVGCGDLLHEAGHLAVLRAEERNVAGPDMGKDDGAEMGAMAWSYAAAVHLHLDAAVVFHAHGYRGNSESLIENFQAGRYLGVPYLQWVGLTAERKRAKELGGAPYPHMLRWVR